MRKLKKHNTGILLILFGILLSSTGLFAQERSGHRPPPPIMIPDSLRIEEMVNELATVLKLTDEQKEKVSKLHTAHFKEVDKLMKQERGNREANREKMNNFMNEFDNKIEALLTDAQKTEFKKFIKRRRRDH